MKKKISMDMLLNIVAAGLPLLALQLVIYPLLSRRIDSELYGLIITLYSLIILVNDPLGRAINNVRLVKNNEKEAVKGDYNVILLIYLIAGLVITVVGCVLYYKKAGKAVALDYNAIIALSITALFFLVDSYIVVYYRIKLKYKAIAINGFCMSFGFVIGFLFFLITEKWFFIFLVGHSFSFIYLVNTTGLLKEPFRITSNFTDILKNTFYITVSILFIQSMSQADKLLLFPLLGGEKLSIYYTAALAGKVMSLAITPVNGVILSYLASRDSLSNTAFKRYIQASVSACSIVAALILLLSRPVLGFLFPMFVDDAMIIVPYTTFNVFLYVVAGMIAPITMKYCALYWQIVINGVSAGLYVILSLILFKVGGLEGFCIGIGISYLIRIILMIVIYKNETKNNSLNSSLGDQVSINE